PTAFATSWTIFPPKQRTKVNIITGLVVTLAPTIGPTLGGYLTTTFSWHWLFLINVAPGIAVTLVVWALIDTDRPNFTVLDGFDLIGLVSMALFLGSLEYVLEEGNRWDWFDDPTIRAYGWVAAIGGAVFFVRVLTYRNPIVDLSAFRNRQFCAGIVFSFVLGIGLYGLTYVLPLFLGRVRHLDAQQIGMIVWVTGVCQFAGGPLCGQLLRRLDARLCLAIGYMGLGISTWWLTEL